jgi:hypothetical protein
MMEAILSSETSVIIVFVKIAVLAFFKEEPAPLLVFR